MRQIPSLAGSATGTGSSTPIITAFVPANSWVDTKLVLMRGLVQFTIPSASFPPTYSVAEGLSITGPGTTPMLYPPSFVPSAGLFSTVRYFGFIRIGSNVYGFDYGDTYQKNWMNNFDALEHAMQLTAHGPAIDFTQQIQLDWNVALPATISTASIAALWTEAFMEQATNLGALN